MSCFYNIRGIIGKAQISDEQGRTLGFFDLSIPEPAAWVCSTALLPITKYRRFIWERLFGYSIGSGATVWRIFPATQVL